jgi:hypothetical protein
MPSYAYGSLALADTPVTGTTRKLNVGSGGDTPTQIGSGMWPARSFVPVVQLV